MYVYFIEETMDGQCTTVKSFTFFEAKYGPALKLYSVIVPVVLTTIKIGSISKVKYNVKTGNRDREANILTEVYR